MIVNPIEKWTGRVLLVVILVLTLIPLVSMISAALQPADENPTGLTWPTDPQWGNFAEAFTTGHVWELLGSSLLIVVGVVPISLIISSLAGYALGSLRIRGSRALLILFILGLTIPFEALIISLYYEMQSLNVLNTQWAIILPLIGLFMPFSVFWMRAHFVGVPVELSEAARVDGAGHGQIFFRLILPLAAPALASFAVLEFIWVWNDLLVATIFAPSSSLPLTQSLNSLSGTWGSQWFLQAAGTFISILVPLIVFFALQRFFVRGLLAGATKG